MIGDVKGQQRQEGWLKGWLLPRSQVWLLLIWQSGEWVRFGKRRREKDECVWVPVCLLQIADVLRVEHVRDDADFGAERNETKRNR